MKFSDGCHGARKSLLRDNYLTAIFLVFENRRSTLRLISLYCGQLGSLPVSQNNLSLAQLNNSTLFMYMAIVFNQVKKLPSNRDSLTHSMASHWETVLHSQEGTDIK